MKKVLISVICLVSSLSAGADDNNLYYRNKRDARCGPERCCPRRPPYWMPGDLASEDDFIHQDESED
jgi:hypothetical protein